MSGPTRYCWHCYAEQPRDAENADRCPRCGRSPQEPGGTTYDDKLLWSLSHPLVERRMIGAAALADRHEARAIPVLRAMAHEQDPYLAAAAVRALAHFPPELWIATARDVAAHGPAPARLAAQRALDGIER